MMNNKPLLPRAAFSLALAVSAATFLNGCGGATSEKKSFAPFVANGPVVYGLDATLASPAIQGPFTTYNETSGSESLDGKTAYVTGAIASDALPIANITDPTTNTIPLGFGPGGRYIDNITYGSALHPGDSFIFRASVSNGLDTSGNFIAIVDPGGVTLSSTDLGIAAQPLTFDLQTKGPLGQGQYKSTTLVVPNSTTTGLHTLSVRVSDVSPDPARHSPSTTTLATLVLAGTDSAVLAQIVDAQGTPVPGATASIDGGLPGAYIGHGQTAPSDTTISVADTQGMVLLFAHPGAHTMTVSSGAQSNTASVTLVAGTVLDTMTTTSNGQTTTSGLQIADAPPALATPAN